MTRFRQPELLLAFAAGIVFFAIWETVLGYQAANCSYQQEYKARAGPSDSHATASNKGGDGSEEQHHKTISEPFVCGVAGLPTAARQFMNRNEGFFVASFTLALVFVTAWLVWATLKLWDAGERQFRHLRRSALIQSRDMQASIEVAKAANSLNREIFAASRRPSLQVKVELAGDFQSDGNYGAVQLQIIAKNVGVAPAINTVCRVMTFPNMYPVNETEQYRLLSESMKGSSRSSSGFGDIIFPEGGVEFSKPSTMATWFQANIEIGKGKGAPTVPGALGICICVDYMPNNDDRHYETGYVYLLLRRQDSGWTSFDLEARIIPQADLMLWRHPVGSRAT
jgi:hypothetical protein